MRRRSVGKSCCTVRHARLMRALRARKSGGVTRVARRQRGKISSSRGRGRRC
jgi:hypothetical protein